VYCVRNDVSHYQISRYFAERIVNVWNFLPSSVNFSTMNAFKRSIVPIDFSLFLKCVTE